MASFAMFPSVFNTYDKRYRRFRLPKTCQKIFLILKFVIDRSCRTIQEVIVLVISNRPCASRSSDFEITLAITPWIVLHSVQLLLLIAADGIG